MGVPAGRDGPAAALAARLRLVAADLRITELSRGRMLDELSATGLTDLLASQAKRYSEGSEGFRGVPPCSTGRNGRPGGRGLRVARVLARGAADQLGERQPPPDF
jgi:hypothetical protein